MSKRGSAANREDLRGLTTLGWILRIAGLLIAAGTAYFVALASLTGPAHGPVIEVVVIDVAAAVGLFIASSKVAKR